MNTNEKNLFSRYLNIDVNIGRDLVDILGNNAIDITLYQEMYMNGLTNHNLIKQYLNSKLETYVNDYSYKLSIMNLDINYYIERVNILCSCKFSQVLKIINSEHIISLLDYNKTHGILEERNNIGSHSSSNNYTYCKISMYNYIFTKIFKEKYKLENTNEFNTLTTLLDTHWNSINFNNLIEFSKNINKLEYYASSKPELDILNDIKIFNDVIISKFDEEINIKKLLEYILENFVEKKEDILGNVTNSAYNFRHIVNLLKLNGFLLFEAYYKNIVQRYKQQLKIANIHRDINLTKYFMKIIMLKDDNNVNRYVNEMLFKIKNYLYDLEDNYENNIAYKKINIVTNSEKYKNTSIDTVKREIANFKIFKYNYLQNKLIDNYSLPNKIQIFLDMYHSYYKSRYPDRHLEYDISASTIITKMTFLEKTYYIHMALIQFIVLEKIFNAENLAKNTCSDVDLLGSIVLEKEETIPIGITLKEIADLTKIELVDLQDTFNSLLKIKIIMRTTESKDIKNIRFVINKNFTFEKNKISISNLIIKENTDTEKIKEFLHDRNTIVLCNIVHYAKKNKFFSKDVLIEYLQYNIPFKLNEEYIENAIKEAIGKEYIELTELENDVLYKYKV
jgi:hypothetical protein